MGYQQLLPGPRANETTQAGALGRRGSGPVADPNQRRPARTAAKPIAPGQVSEAPGRSISKLARLALGALSSPAGAPPWGSLDPALPPPLCAAACTATAQPRALCVAAGRAPGRAAAPPRRPHRRGAPAGPPGRPADTHSGALKAAPPLFSLSIYLSLRRSGLARCPGAQARTRWKACAGAKHTCSHLQTNTRARTYKGHSAQSLCNHPCTHNTRTHAHTHIWCAAAGGPRGGWPRAARPHYSLLRCRVGRPQGAGAAPAGTGSVGAAAPVS